MSKDYNSGLDTAARIVEEVIGGTSEGETILCGIESSKKCKYGEINSKDYECLQKQWEIMHNALFLLEDVASEESVLRIIQCTLKALDKEWNKIYSKEDND